MTSRRRQSETEPAPGARRDRAPSAGPKVRSLATLLASSRDRSSKKDDVQRLEDGEAAAVRVFSDRLTETIRRRRARLLRVSTWLPQPDIAPERAANRLEESWRRGLRLATTARRSADRSDQRLEEIWSDYARWAETEAPVWTVDRDADDVEDPPRSERRSPPVGRGAAPDVADIEPQRAEFHPHRPIKAETGELRRPIDAPPDLSDVDPYGANALAFEPAPDAPFGDMTAPPPPARRSHVAGGAIGAVLAASALGAIALAFALPFADGEEDGFFTSDTGDVGLSAAVLPVDAGGEAEVDASLWIDPSEIEIDGAGGGAMFAAIASDANAVGAYLSPEALATLLNARPFKCVVADVEAGACVESTLYDVARSQFVAQTPIGDDATLELVGRFARRGDALCHATRGATALVVGERISDAEASATERLTEADFAAGGEICYRFVAIDDGDAFRADAFVGGRYAPERSDPRSFLMLTSPSSAARQASEPIQ